MKPFREWGKNALGEVILTSTEDAIEYARLIYDISSRVDTVESCLSMNQFRLVSLMEEQAKTLKDISRLATKSQRYRECLEEVARLRTTSGFKV